MVSLISTWRGNCSVIDADVHQLARSFHFSKPPRLQFDPHRSFASGRFAADPLKDRAGGAARMGDARQDAVAKRYTRPSSGCSGICCVEDFIERLNRQCRAPGMWGPLDQQSGRELTSTVPTTRARHAPIQTNEHTAEIHLRACCLLQPLQSRAPSHRPQHLQGDSFRGHARMETSRRRKHVGFNDAAISAPS